MKNLRIILLCAVLAVANGHFKGKAGVKGGSIQVKYTKGGSSSKDATIKGDILKGNDSEHATRGDIPDYEASSEEIENVDRGDIPYEPHTHDSTQSTNTYITKDYSKYEDRTDDYINYIKLQQEQVLKAYDEKLKNFREYYSALVEGISVQESIVVKSVARFQEYLHSLEYLSDVSKKCIHNYREYIPYVEDTKSAFEDCIVNVSNEIESLLSEALQVRSFVQTYYNINFNNDIENCRQKYVNDINNLTSCLQEVVSDSNNYTIQSQKEFEYRLEAAACKARATMKRTTECFYSVQSETITRIGKATIYITNCRAGREECEKCPDHTCSDSVDIQHDYTAPTIVNPFLKIEKPRGCVMLNLT